MKKTVLITGASAGIGSAIAHRLFNNGWRLVLMARRVERLVAIQKELDPLQKDIFLLNADIKDMSAVDKAIADIPECFFPISGLINNAGLALGLDPAWESDPNDWEIMVQTNINGLLYVTRAILPKMVAENEGHIINLGSIAGSWPYPGGHVYGATKAFVQQFSRNLRADLIGKKIRVTNIEPGIVETEFSDVRFKGDTEKARKIYENANALIAEDIAEIVSWVLHLHPRVNINSIEVMPTSQAWGPLVIHRKK